MGLPIVLTFAVPIAPPMALPRFKHLPLVIVLIVVAAASRLLPHPPNFVPTGAMVLFGAAALPKRWLAVLVPLMAFYISDLALNNILYAEYFEGFYFGISPYTYGALLLMILLGMGLLRGRSFSWLRIGASALGATLVFFLVTNFGVWAGGFLYPKNVAGLMAAFAAGIPFLLSSLLANLLFTGVFFGIGKAAGVFGKAPTRGLAFDTITGK